MEEAVHKKPTVDQVGILNKLPRTIIQNILSLLPIKEAGRTSILSKDWRYIWTQIPRVEFNDEAFEIPESDDDLTALEASFIDVENPRRLLSRRSRIFSAIYQVLLKHQEPIIEFSLKIRTDRSSVEVDHFISYLSEKNKKLERLTIDVDMGFYTLPSYLYSLHGLSDLSVYRCNIKPLPASIGFTKLLKLVLRHVFISKSSLVHLLTGCPSLKELFLETQDTVGDVGDDRSTIKDLLGCFSVLEYLSIYFTMIKNFFEDDVPVPSIVIHLKEIYIRQMCFLDKKAFPLLVFLFKCAPNLTKLKIEACQAPPYDEDQSPPALNVELYHDILLTHLQVFEFCNVRNIGYELDVVNFILANSLQLKKVCLEFEDEEEAILQIVSQLDRLSAGVEIVVKKK